MPAWWSGALAFLMAGAAVALAGAVVEEKDQAAHVHRVAISNLKFDPRSLEAQAGDVVVWTNNDFVAHSATADDGTFDTGTLEGGQSKRVVAVKKGIFPYHCRYHTTMKGTLTVR
jgi:plastocyanin